MIKNNEALSMVEAIDIVKKTKTENPDLIGFVNKFNKLKPEKTKEIRKKINELKLLKVTEDHIAKIIDLLPETAGDLNKIFIDVGLDEDETKKVLDIVKEYI